MKEPFLAQSAQQTSEYLSIGNIFENTKSFFTQVVTNPVDKLLLPLGSLLLIIFLTFIFLKALNRLIDRIFILSKVESNKAITLRKMIKSITRYAIYFFATLTILVNFGFNPMPVLAGAGIIGLAIGFGAQSLVKDIISGFFLIFERQLEVGDVVEINGEISGTVEEVGLRISKVREFNQRLHYLANGTITQVANYNRERMKAAINITVPFESDLGLVTHAIEEIGKSLYYEFQEDFLEEPHVIGITNLNEAGVQFTLGALCKPEHYWKLEREMRRKAVVVLHQYNIEISYPRSVVYQPESIHTKEDKK